MSPFFAWLGRTVVRLRWLIVVVWIVATVVATRALPSISSQVNNDNSAFLPADAPSNKAAKLAEPLVGPAGRAQVVVVAVATSGPFTAADQSYLTRLADDMARVPSVVRVRFLGVSPDRQAVQLLAQSSRSLFDQSAGTRLVDDLSTAIAGSHRPADLRVHLAGQLATDVANRNQSTRTQNLTQALTLLFILILLLAIFRAVLAPLVMLVPAFLVLALSERLIGGLGSLGLKISSVTPLLLIVLVLGAGTDYGLFLVFRVREELQRGQDAKAATSYSVARVGESITASGGTVIVALLTLLLASFGIYHDLGAPLAVGIAVMLLAGLTLVPALLAIFGRAVFWPSRKAVQPGERSEGVWGRVAASLVRRPGWTLAIGVVALGSVALAVFGYRAGGFGQGLQAPPGSDAAAGNAAVRAHFPKAAANPTNLVFVYPGSVWSDPSVLVRAQRALAGSPPFRTLTGPLDPNGAPLRPAQLVALHDRLGPPAALPAAQPGGSGVPPVLYNAYRATALYVSAGGHTVQFEAGLKAGDPSSSTAIQAVPAVRRSVERAARLSGALSSGAAGEAPALYDVSTTSNGDLVRIVPLAVLAIGIVLALVLRSLVAPLYLILSVVLSYLASLGLAVLFFVELGGQRGITFLLPFLMFIFLLALGEDYNILVMTRIREEAHRLSLRRAVVRAVGATGPTVTSAGLVLAGSFLVLAASSAREQGGSEVAAIGVGLAVGILLDTFVVRTVLVPATVELLGRWNWWPARAACRAPAGAWERHEPFGLGGTPPGDGTGGTGGTGGAGGAERRGARSDGRR